MAIALEDAVRAEVAAVLAAAAGDILITLVVACPMDRLDAGADDDSDCGCGCGGTAGFCAA